eukprot:m.41987 g.41987  ORF g.41987 m.41987 type:complete len:168 (+) comp16936_c0_seq1:53-556(+)
MKFVLALAVVLFFVAEAYASSCTCYATCSDGVKVKSSFGNVTCSDCASYCPLYQEFMCYNGNHGPVDCGLGSGCGSYCGADVALAVGIIVAIVIACLVACICIPVAICFFAGLACFAGSRTTTTYVQHTNPPNYQPVPQQGHQPGHQPPPGHQPYQQQGYQQPYQKQ